MNTDPLQPTQALRAAIDKNGAAVGTFLNLGSAVTTEICARYFDWVLIDQEHGPGGRETLLTQLMAARAGGALAIVRLPSPCPTAVKQALDLGADGVMLPQIMGAADAGLAIDAMHYPPTGTRGVSKVNRSCGFGLDFAQKLADQGQSLVGMVQIETSGALDNVEAIAALAGVAVLFIGPLDLSVNLGCPGDLNHADFIAACERVVHAAQGTGKHAGILAPNAAIARQMQQRGMTVIAIGSDGLWVEENARLTAATYRGR